MPITKMNGKKRDGKQAYRVRANYTDALGNYKQLERTIYGLEEARNAERELIASAREIGAGSGISLQELHDEYCRVKIHEVREGTVAKCKEVMRLHVLPTLGDVKLSKMNVARLQQWKTEVEEKGFAIKMRQNIFATFRAELNYAVKMEYIQSNPLVKLGNFKATDIEPQKIDYYTGEEFKKFIAAAKEAVDEKGGNEQSYYIFFMLLFYTGARKGEVNALRWIDYDGKLLNIRASVNQKLKGGDRITGTKNRSSMREIQAPEPLIVALADYRTWCEGLLGFSEDWFICGAERTLRDTSIENHNIQYAKAAGIKKIRIHDFRHSHASLLANAGINIQEIARRLGHANVEMTWNTYSHLYPREEERAVQILNKIGGISGKGKKKSLET